MTTPTYSPVLLPLIRRVMPKLLAHQICGVQPMTGPTAGIFSLRTKYIPDNRITQITDEVFRLEGDLLEMYEWFDSTTFAGEWSFFDEEEVATRTVRFSEPSDAILFKLTWYENV